MNGHRGRVLWFTGYSGAGKTTLANALEMALHVRGMHTYLVDGDHIRHGLNRDLGFSEGERSENIRRIAEVAKLMVDSGLIVLGAFISPFRRDRTMARDIIGAERFSEIFVDTPLHVCEARDVKGLYRKARDGLIPDMTGVNSPYEAPLDPDYVANGAGGSVDATVLDMLRALNLTSAG
jgi:bifunctional enzyme CysN/CysC